MAGQFRGKVAIVTGGGSGIGEALCRELARRGAQVIVADINAADASRVAAIISGDGGSAAARVTDVTHEHDVLSLVQDTVSANAPYATAKHAVLGMSLGLRIEAADLGVKVSCVCPGFVRTNIFQNSLSVNPHVPDDVPLEELAGAPSKMMPAARAAEIILDGVANRALIVFPASIRWARHIHDLFPQLIESEVLRQFRRRKQKIAAALAVSASSQDRCRACSPSASDHSARTRR
jgi:NAD(P)-dependent dehydrogenase (short-subunit alcohol dehydrogenase family)